MPHKKSPNKLQDISVSIASELLRKVNNKRLTDSDNWPIGRQSPFLCCPNSVIQEIINHLGISVKGNAEKVIHKHVLQLLLCRSFENLDLTSIRIHENELADVLELIIPSAPNLQSLQIFADTFGTETKDQFIDLISRTHVAPVLTNLAQNFNRITHLHLLNLCYDEILTVIGENCPELVVLKAVSEAVTDIGLINLCTNGKKPTAVDFELRCQKLQQVSLDPRAEGITNVGIHTLLTYLPVLKIIEGCIIGSVLEDVYGRHDSISYSKVEYKLTHFMYDWRRVQSNGVVGMRIALHTCPFITNLKLLEPTDESLVQLGSLNYLTNLTIISYTNQTNFEIGVLPFLQQAGINIIKLSLSLGKIDLASIDWCCPKLQVLDCSNVRQIFSTSEYSKTPFINLRDFVFHANLRTTLSAETLKIVLSHCSELESLYISYCISFTDQVLDDILEVNPLLKLKCLHLMYVERLSAVGIESLVMRESDLKKLWLFNVSGNHKVTLRHVKEIVTTLNIDLEIDLILPDMKLPEFGLNFEHYMVQDLSLFHLVKQEFIEAFIKRGKLYLMSEGTKADLDNCLLVLPTNELIVYLGKDTYQELGIQGQPIVGKSKDIQTFVIRINLTAESFIPGKRNYDRVLERFNLYSHLRFNCLVAWEPNNDSICSSSIAAYFEKQLHLNVRLGKFNEKRKTNISYTIPLIQPFELGNFEDVFDWIGLITNDFDNSSADNFITEFLPEMPVCKEKKVDCIHWRGFFTRGLLQSLFEILRPAISGLSWIAIAIHGFDDIPVSKVLKKGCNYKEDERNLVCFIMFADGHHWKFFSTGRQKML